MSFLHTKILVLGSLLCLGRAAAVQNCKCTPDEPCWPAQPAWDAFNASVSGHLIRAFPPASVCYAQQPNYDASACQQVTASWFNSSFHAADPISVGWPWWANNTCPPIFPNGTSISGDPDAGAKGCKIGGYPVYALNASTPIQIQLAINFARENNIRLNVKSTGHSFQGRSTAYASLSVWTHNMRGAEWHENFQVEGCATNNEAQLAATLAAGERVRQVNEFASAHNGIVVAGSDPDVGIVGWFTGGGHGPLSTDYGMGADNVLQARVVTPSGEFVTANACQHTDLFYALRGGGGGTFGVVTEVTMRAYPSPKTSRHVLRVTAQNSNTSLSKFINMVAHVLSDTPRLKDGGMQGYITIYPPGIPELGGTFQWGLYIYNKSESAIESLLSPLTAILDHYNGTEFSITSRVDHAPDFFTMWDKSVGFERVASTGMAMGAQFLPADAFADTARLSAVLLNITTPAPNGGPVAIETMMVANSNRRGNDIAMNAAWRDAVMAFVLEEGFHDFADYNEAKTTLDRVTYQRVRQLRTLAPRMGAYFNEADAYDPDWQELFWGDNYARLLAIKQRYDPDSLFWCRSCAGSEAYVEVEKQSGRLCKRV